MPYYSYVGEASPASGVECIAISHLQGDLFAQHLTSVQPNVAPDITSLPMRRHSVDSRPAAEWFRLDSSPRWS